MQSNAVVVTAPDLYFADQPSILLIGCDDYLQDIVENVRRLPIAVTVYSATNESTLDWISTAYFQSSISILNCAYNEFFTGFFIDKTDVFYYNSKESYKRFNLNEVADPIEPLIKWMTEWQENPDKNAVSL